MIHLNTIKEKGNIIEKSDKDFESFSKKDSLCLKGIAIIILMFHHLFRAVGRFKLYTVDFLPFTQNFVVNMSDYFKICVGIFAFISGYGLYLSAKNKCNDLKSTEKWTASRLIKTMSGFYFVYILSFIITEIYAKFPQTVYCEKGYIRGIIYAVIDFFGMANLFSTPTMCSTWWYMSAAIVFIILIPIVIKWSQRLGYTTLIIGIIALPRLIGKGYPGGTNIYTFILAVILGMIFAQFDIFKRLDKIKITNNKFLSEIIQFIFYFTLLILSIVIWIKFPRDKVWEYQNAIAPIISIYFCKRYIIRLPIVKQILCVFGKYSMDIFLIHTFIRYTFFQDFIYGFKYFWLISLVLFTISLLISVLIEFLKKIIHFDDIINIMTNKICTLIDSL